MQRQRGELVPIGDAVSGLRSPVTTKPKTKTHRGDIRIRDRDSHGFPDQARAVVVEPLEETAIR